MQDILEEKEYAPPKVELLQVQVEVGFYGTYPSGGGGSIGGGGSTTDDPLYDFGGSTVTGMPAEPF